jgi:pyrimidine operon attenuation protein / uracil phosphoribosyltransferase
VADRERIARPTGRVFVARAQVMDSDELRRALMRIAHEIVERNRGLDGVVVVGLQTGGVFLAERLAAILEEIEGAPVPLGSIDVAFYRDDIGLHPVHPEEVTDLAFDITGKTVVLVDDVLFTGRTVRAALEALAARGRAGVVELAVLVDRGHRELPIRPDFVGKNLPTRRDESVDVSEEGVSIGDLVTAERDRGAR